MSTPHDETTIVAADEPPSIPSPWSMTELDSANTIFALRGAWLFERPLDAARLRRGLAAVLSRYPHLAGRMVRGSAVTLGNQGVPFSVCSRPELSVAGVVAAPALAHRYAPRLRPGRMRRGADPLLAVRLTQLRTGSLLNVTCSHGCVDGRAFYAFVQNWARACAGLTFPTPVLDTSLVPCPASRQKAEVVGDAEALGWARLRLGTVLRVVMLDAFGRLGERRLAGRLSPAALRRLRREAVAETGCGALRTYEALAAHLTLLCGRLVGLPADAEVSEVTVLDARGRVAALPATYAGNAPFVVRAASFPVGAPLGRAALAIHQGLGPMLTTPSAELARQMALARELVRHQVWYLPYDLGAVHGSPRTLSYVNDFATLPVYDVDFGEPGAPLVPLRVFPHDLPDPVLIWPAPPSEGGVELYLAGSYARALGRLHPTDPWHADLGRFERTS